MQSRSYIPGCTAIAVPLVAALMVAAASARAAETKAVETKAGAALAETELTTPVQMRTGPSDHYPPVKRLAKGLDVDVHGCLQTWDWCDVEWRGARGWVPAGVVAFQRDESPLPLSRYGTTLGVPVVGFSLGSYWDAHYKAEAWYGERDRWMQRSARLENGGVVTDNVTIENTAGRTAVAARRAPVVNLPVSAPPVTPQRPFDEALSTPVNAPPRAPEKSSPEKNAPVDTAATIAPNRDVTPTPVTATTIMTTVRPATEGLSIGPGF